MRFFIYRSKGVKGRYYVLLHNNSLKPVAIHADLSNSAGDILTAADFGLPGLGSGLFSIEDIFPALTAADAHMGRVLHMTTTQPVSPTALFWDSDSGLITAQHH
jgi:hypothetical protein